MDIKKPEQTEMVTQISEGFLERVADGRIPFLRGLARILLLEKREPVLGTVTLSVIGTLMYYIFADLAVIKYADLYSWITSNTSAKFADVFGPLTRPCILFLSLLSFCWAIPQWLRLSHKAENALTYKYLYDTLSAQLGEWTPPLFRLSAFSISNTLREKYRLRVRLHSDVDWESAVSQLELSHTNGERTIPYPDEPLRYFHNSKKISIDRISEEFNSTLSASDFHCVILALPTCSTLKNDKWADRCKYFSNFYRPPQDKRHIICRIFSVPAIYTGNGLKALLNNTEIFHFKCDDFDTCTDRECKTCNKKSKSEKTTECSQGVILLTNLIINKLCGVDTRLHLFQCMENQVRRKDINDFFEAADYVMMRSVVTNSHKAGIPHSSWNAALWVLAEPTPGENDEQVYRIEDPLLLQAFDEEFYRRLTAKSTKKLEDGADKLTQFTEDNLLDTCRMLNVSLNDIRNMKGILHYVRPFSDCKEMKREIWLKLVTEYLDKAAKLLAT